MLSTAIAAAAFALAFVPALLYLANVCLYRRALRPVGPLPPVSILVPARNEERSIAAAIETALSTVGVEFEVVVLDDQSEDGTATVVAEYAARDGRVRLFHSCPLPGGWCGKMFACHQLAQHAQYPVLAFIDADVRLAPDGLARLVA